LLKQITDIFLEVNWVVRKLKWIFDRFQREEGLIYIEVERLKAIEELSAVSFRKYIK